MTRPSAQRKARHLQRARFFPGPQQQGKVLGWLLLVILMGMLLVGTTATAVYFWQKSQQAKPHSDITNTNPLGTITLDETNKTAATPLVTSSPNIPTSPKKPVNPSPITQSAGSTAGSLSGILQITGPLEANSSVLILWRPTGTSQWQTWKRIAALNDSIWKISGAQIGQSYQVQAALQVNEQNSATSSIVTVTASSANQILALDTGVKLNAPSQSPHLQSCITHQANDKWRAEIAFPKVEKAGSYRLQIGTQDGLSDYTTVTKNTTGTDEEVFTIELDNNRELYAKYAYALCQNCAAAHNFSPYSKTVVVKCMP